jgi:hypothetical protein
MIFHNLNMKFLIIVAIFGVPGLFEELSTDFDTLAPITFDYQNSDDPDKITNAIKHFYFGGENVFSSEKHVQNLTDVSKKRF